ncbi:MAG: anti-sigma factor family protein [Janthinobacterium lividum]
MTKWEHDPSTPGADDAAELHALSALVDNELSADERERVVQGLAQDPQAAARVADYRAQKAALQALFAHQQAPECIVLRPQRSWFARFGVAASWLVVGAAVGLSAGMWSLHTTGGRSVFAERADIAYAVYAPERRHPVEVAADQRDHLTTWLSNRLDRPLTIPSLSAYGFTLVGGRLLPGEAGPAAQLMYQDAAGQRVTLYMTPVPKDMYKIRLLDDGSRRTFYWADKHIGYALSGQLPEAQLRTISYEVCSSLGGDPTRW